jgi:DinB superfamily
MSPDHERPAADEASDYYRTYIALVPDGGIVPTLQAQQARLLALLQGVSEPQALAYPAPGEWSVKQVVQHLIDTERLFCFRALWFARGEQAALPGMEPDPWMALTDPQTRTLDDLLREYGHVRAASSAFFSSLTPAAWLRRGTASGALISVRALAWLIAGHTQHHISALEHQLAVSALA